MTGGTSLRIRELRRDERPRERLAALGAGALSLQELLAVIVGSGGRGHSASEVAAELLGGAGGALRRLAAATPAELAARRGVGPAVAARVAAALELGRRLGREGAAERVVVRSPRDVYEHCAPTMRDLLQEEFRLLILTAQHAVSGEATLTRGVLDASLIHPREVFRAAIQGSAAAIVLVHNHPSGDPTPSAEDRAVTRQLAEAGAVIGIPVLDHVIIGDGRYASLVEAGLLAPR